MVNCRLCEFILDESQYTEHLKKFHMKRGFGVFDCPNDGCNLRFHKLRKLN